MSYLSFCLLARRWPQRRDDIKCDGGLFFSLGCNLEIQKDAINYPALVHLGEDGIPLWEKKRLMLRKLGVDISCRGGAMTLAFDGEEMRPTGNKSWQLWSTCFLVNSGTYMATVLTVRGRRVITIMFNKPSTEGWVLIDIGSDTVKGIINLISLASN